MAALILMLLSGKQVRDAGGSESGFLATGKPYSPRISVVLEDYQHLTDWEEGKACEMFFSSWYLCLEKEVQFGSLI